MFTSIKRACYIYIYIYSVMNFLLYQIEDITKDHASSYVNNHIICFRFNEFTSFVRLNK